MKMSIETYAADVLIDRRFTLSESPVWDERTDALHFADISANRVYRYDTATCALDHIDTFQNVGCFALREEGGYILGLTTGVYLLNNAHDSLRRLPAPLLDPMTRMNDGKCDAKGRFFLGSADLYGFGAYKGGKLFMVSESGECTTLLEGIGCSNGIAFAQDGKTVYYIDSVRHQVERYVWDEDARALRDMRVIIRIDPTLAVPDGMTMDEDGMLWIAHWGAGFVGRYDPRTGALLCRVTVDATQCSSCCFGGADMRTLFITSGRGGEAEPHGGCVFRADLPYRGMPSPRYRR